MKGDGLAKPKQGTYGPSSLLSAVQRAHPSFRGNHQQDAHELFMHLLGTLEDEEDAYIKRRLEDEKEEEEEESKHALHYKEENVKDCATGGDKSNAKIEGKSCRGGELEVSSGGTQAASGSIEPPNNHITTISAVSAECSATEGKGKKSSGDSVVNDSPDEELKASGLNDIGCVRGGGDRGGEDTICDSRRALSAKSNGVRADAEGDVASEAWTSSSSLAPGIAPTAAGDDVSPSQESRGLSSSSSQDEEATSTDSFLTQTNESSDEAPAGAVGTTATGISKKQGTAATKNVPTDSTVSATVVGENGAVKLENDLETATGESSSCQTPRKHGGTAAQPPKHCDGLEGKMSVSEALPGTRPEVSSVMNRAKKKDISTCGVIEGRNEETATDDEGETTDEGDADGDDNTGHGVNDTTTTAAASRPATGASPPPPVSGLVVPASTAEVAVAAVALSENKKKYSKEGEEEEKAKGEEKRKERMAIPSRAAITEVFGGSLCSVVTCGSCRARSFNTEPTICLSLEIPLKKNAHHHAWKAAASTATNAKSSSKSAKSSSKASAGEKAAGQSGKRPTADQLEGVKGPLPGFEFSAKEKRRIARLERERQKSMDAEASAKVDGEPDVAGDNAQARHGASAETSVAEGRGSVSPQRATKDEVRLCLESIIQRACSVLGEDDGGLPVAVAHEGPPLSHQTAAAIEATDPKRTETASGLDPPTSTVESAVVTPAGAVEDDVARASAHERRTGDKVDANAVVVSASDLTLSCASDQTSPRSLDVNLGVDNTDRKEGDPTPPSPVKAAGVCCDGTHCCERDRSACLEIMQAPPADNVADGGAQTTAADPGTGVGGNENRYQDGENESSGCDEEVATTNTTRAIDEGAAPHTTPTPPPTIAATETETGEKICDSLSQGQGLRTSGEATSEFCRSAFISDRSDEKDRDGDEFQQKDAQATIAAKPGRSELDRPNSVLSSASASIAREAPATVSSQSASPSPSRCPSNNGEAGDVNGVPTATAGEDRLRSGDARTNRNGAMGEMVVTGGEEEEQEQEQGGIGAGNQKGGGICENGNEEGGSPMVGERSLTPGDSSNGADACAGVRTCADAAADAAAEKNPLNNLVEPPPRVKNSGRRIDASGIDLYTCLDHFMAEEELVAAEGNGYDCESCRSHAVEAAAAAPAATVQTDGGDEGEQADEEEKQAPTTKNKQDARKRLLMLGEPPGILVCHLKRLQAHNQILRSVEFPEELDMASYFWQDSRKPLPPTATRYRLFGLVEHRGNRWGGHYVAYVRDEDGWKHASDRDIRPAVLNEVKNAKAYMLFYERCEKDPASKLDVGASAAKAAAGAAIPKTVETTVEAEKSSLELNNLNLDTTPLDVVDQKATRNVENGKKGSTVVHGGGVNSKLDKVAPRAVERTAPTPTISTDGAGRVNDYGGGCDGGVLSPLTTTEKDEELPIIVDEAPLTAPPQAASEQEAHLGHESERKVATGVMEKQLLQAPPFAKMIPELPTAVVEVKKSPTVEIVEGSGTVGAIC